jgi:hypothetical protein
MLTEAQLSPREEHHALKKWGGRIGGILFGLLMAWLLIEVLLRIMFFSLPPRLQLILDEVRVTPFTDRKLMPDPIWQPDIDYLTITRPVTNYEQFGSAEVHFKVSTSTLWGQRGAFRTRQEDVDRHVDGIALGDSFTFCFTEEQDCWVKRLGDLTQRNIINLGVTSTGSVAHQRVLENFGVPLKPPLVIWQWWGNDANEDYGLASLRGETNVKSTHPAPPVPHQNWWGQHSAAYVLLKMITGSDDQFEGSLQFLDREHAAKGKINLAFGRPYLWGAFDMSEPTNQYGWGRSQQAFLDSKALIDSYGGHLLIILIPTKEQVYRDMAEPLIGPDHMALLDQDYSMMLGFCAAQKLDCLDLLPIFQQHTAEQLYYTTDIHLNKRGNEVLAEALADWLGQHPAVFEPTAAK